MFLAFGLAGVLTKLDNFGQSVSLNLNGKDEKKSLIGAFISLGMYALTLYLSFSTLLDYIYQTNPVIHTSIEYDAQNLTMDYKNFFFGLSFYYPLKSSRSISKESNDLSEIKLFNQINISCTTCEGDYKKPSTLMNLCHKDEYNDIKLKSLSDFKSDGINSIFTDHSFCFPTDFKSIIKDNDTKNSTQDSSLQLYIPISDVSIEYLSIKTNSEPQPGNESFNLIEGKSSSERKKNKQKSIKNKQEIPSLANENISPKVNQKNAPTRNLFETTSVSLKDLKGIFSTRQNQGNETIDYTIDKDNDKDYDKDKDKETRENRKSKRFTNSLNKRMDFKLRNLQTSNSNFNAKALKDFKNQMEAVFDTFRFPKMLIMHRNVEVNSRSDPHINFVYHFETLDYYDSLTGNPNVFDIYLEKYQIFIEQGCFLFCSEPKIIEFLVIAKIQKNELDSIDSDGAHISFKLVSDTKQIHLVYTGFADFLGVYGSFYATFVIAAAVLSSIYKEIFFNQVLINSVFRFVETSPAEKHEFKNFIINERNKPLDRKNSNSKIGTIEPKNLMDNNEVMALKENEKNKDQGKNINK